MMGRKWGAKAGSVLGVGLAIVMTMGVPEAGAAGKKKPKPQPEFTTPRPVRDVLLQDVGTTPFHLPNGQAATENIGADLKRLLEDAVVDTGVLRSKDSGSSGTEDACDMHLELRAGVSILELNITQIGLTVGYSFSSDSNQMALTNLDGKFDVTIGNIAMNFGVWECAGTDCVEIVTSEATHVTANVSLAMEIDFSAVKTGPALIWKTPLANALKAIMEDGIRRLTKDPCFDRLYWRGAVQQDYDPTLANSVYVNAGKSRGIGLNEMFEVYSVQPAQGSCGVYKVVGYGHTFQVNQVSSIIRFDDTFYDPAIVKQGDVVMIHAPNLHQSCTK